jgi:beta-aspartyl-dipeptidase (metallo-type)
MLTLIRGADVNAPEPIGRRDVLVAAGKILAIAETIQPPAGLEVDVVEASGKTLAPGFIDLHVHITGGGGEGGPATRCPEIQLGAIVGAGVTTVLGLLGTDDVSRRPETLLAKALGLEQEGVTAFVMSGSYAFPPAATITGSLKKDIALIPNVVGVGEIAISDHRSAQPTYEDLVKTAAEARVGGLLGGKAGLVQLHMGDGPRAMQMLFRLVEETEIPIGQLLPTHVARAPHLFEDAVRFCRMGGNIDLTASEERRSAPRLDTAEALRRLKAAGVSLDQVTISSDSNGSLPVFNDRHELVGMAVGDIHNLQLEFRRLVLEDGFDAAEILRCLTLNPARRLKLEERKGRVAAGADADLILFAPGWQIDSVYARGRKMVSGGRVIVKGTFEKFE